MDRKVIIIFISVAVLQTISWYLTSRNFFRINLFSYLQSDPDVYIYEYLYWFIGDFFTFFLLSVLIIKFVLKENLKNYGLQIGDFKIGLALSIIFFIVMLPAIWFFSATPDFSAKYPHLLSTRDNWNEFFIYEGGMLLYMISWEFIWRGFMLFGLKEKFGYYSGTDSNDTFCNFAQRKTSTGDFWRYSRRYCTGNTCFPYQLNLLLCDYTYGNYVFNRFNFNFKIPGK